LRIFVLAVGVLGLASAFFVGSSASPASADYAATVLADHPVSYWRLNDSSGSTAVDQQGLNPGQISGATLSEPGPMVGDASMRFARGGLVNLGRPAPATLRPSGSWTIETWIKASASEAAQCGFNFGPFCDLYSFHAFGFHLALDSDGTISGTVDSDSTTGVEVTSPSSTSYADNQWHYVVLVWSSSGLSLFVDGAQVANTPNGSSTTYTCCEGAVAIANDSACFCGPFTGWMSEVAFYNYPLTAAQVKAHYAAAPPVQPPLPSPPQLPPPPPVGGSRYVAMGDSYSAGEGTASYDRGTDTSNNKCHRSSEDSAKASYPRLLQLDSSAVPSNMKFVACSGARINDILNRWQYPDQPPQVQALRPDVTLVTLSIGGNDLGFTSVLEECVNQGPTHFRSDETCVGQDSELRDKLWGSDPLNTRLINLYRAIKKEAPNARIVVMGYPRLFPLGNDNSCGLPGLPYLDSFKIAWLNQWTGILDAYLEETVNNSGVAEYVSTFNAMTDAKGDEHNACPHLFVEPWINELQLGHPTPIIGHTSESFHPNPSGYVALANALLPTIDGAPSGSSFAIGQGQIVGPSVTVPPAASWLTVGVSWPGSTVATTLVTPKGRVISPHTAAKLRGVQHEVGPTYELYSIANPEPGHWQIRALGVSVAAGGEPVRISVRTERRRHRPPIARATARPTHGRAPLRVVLSARGSRAAEGRVARYLWEFGDGHKGKGRRVKHTYRHPGRYTALLKVIDTSGVSTLASTKTITIRR
jgi:lysophospholipase L1-like esterase